MKSSNRQPIVAIVGRANVGKSSLFNAVLNSRENIIAREEGTTRDSISALTNYRSHSFWLVDTAGLKAPEDDFEASIQSQIDEAIENADLIWLMIEAKTIITNEDRQLAQKVLKSQKPVFLIVNKIDQEKSVKEAEYLSLGIKQIQLTSMTQHRGLRELLDALVDAIPKVTTRTNPVDIRLAIIGRPNVGKSQLFNTLLKKQQAIVSDRAGTTRDINRQIVRYKNQAIELLDTAGIRRSGKIQRGVEQFSVLRTLSAIEESDVCLLLMDVNELNVGLDQKIAGMVKDAGKGLILTASKWDSIEDKTAFTHDQLMAEIKRTYDFVPWASLIFTSAVSGQNVAQLLELVIDIEKQRQKKIKTSVLNSWLREVVAKHQPAGLKNFMPKLNYMVQEQDNPAPVFKIYGSHARLVHWSYKRYLERELRTHFGFEGTAIKFWFFEKHIDRKKPVRSEKKV